MTTNRSRYSTAPTYGMQKRPAPKKQAAPAGQVYPPAANAPGGPYQQPAAPGYAPQNIKPHIPAQHIPPQPVYTVQPVNYGPAPGYMPKQPIAQQYPPQAAMPVQPMPYYPQQPYAAQPIPQEYTVRPRSRGGDGWLQILMLAVLPILFILTLLVTAPALKIVFIAGGVLSLIAMWMQKAFVLSARSTLSLVYGALILVSLVSLITTSTPRDTQTSARGNGSNALGYAGNAPTPSPDGMVQVGIYNNIQPTDTPQPTEVPNSGENSVAWQRLQQFFNFWIINNTHDMLDIVSPSWKAAQDKAETQLFLILSNRIPLDYSFERISNTDNDTTRTVTMTATIDKRNSRPPVKLRFQILMIKINGEWYVDPNSLNTNDIVQDVDTSENAESEEDTSTGLITPKPTATPSSNTKMYYNKDGGKYYHANSECPSVSEKYLPLTNFYYKDLNKSTFKALLPCPYCDAPDRP